MDSSRGVRVPAPVTVALVLAAVLTMACSGGGGPGAAPEGPAISSDPTPNGDPQPSAGTSEGSDPVGSTSTEVVRVTDEMGKATSRGDVPSYAEISQAEVRGTLDELTFHIVLAGRIPASIGRSETARVTVGILAENGDRYSLYAQGSQDGWAGYAVGGEAGPFPGELEVKQRRMTLSMPRDHFGSLPSFRWLVNVAFSKGNAYGFDALPDEGYARFP